MKRFKIRVEETIATLIGEDWMYEEALKVIEKVRGDLKGYISKDPNFLRSLNPLKVGDDAPQIVKRMAQAASAAGVGPMAAVAGGIAQMVVEELVKLGAEHVIFDNGGDIVMKIQRETVVGLYTARPQTSGFGFLIRPTGEIVSICTSSGRVGHSLSFGIADAAVVFSKDGFLADAVATALGNRVKEENVEVLKRAVEWAVGIDGVEGAVVVVGELWAMGGAIPEIVKAEVDVDLISKG